MSLIFPKFNLKVVLNDYEFSVNIFRRLRIESLSKSDDSLFFKKQTSLIDNGPKFQTRG